MKKLLVLVFMLVMFSTLALAVEPGQVTEGKAVDVSLLSQEPVQVQPGNYVEVRVNIENTGVDKLEDFMVEVVPQYPFSLKKGEDKVKEFGTVRGGFYGDDSVVAKWKLRVDKNAVGGDNELKLRYKYAGTDWLYPEELEISVKTLDSIINVKKVETSPEKISPGEEFNLSLEVQNEADSFVENLRLRLDLKDDFVNIGSTNDKFIRTLDGEERTTVKYNLISKGDITSSIIDLPLKMTYYNNRGEERSKNVSVGLVIDHTPEVIKNIEDKEVHMAGDKGSVDVSLSNVGIGEVKFLKLRMKPSDEYRIISSDEIYLGNIDSDDYETGSFEIKTSSEVSEDVTLDYEMIYKDQLNREYNDEFSLTLPIYSKEEAKELGFIEERNPIVTYLLFVIVVLLFAFWLYMLFDLIRLKAPRYKKLVWLIILLLTTIFGAVLYYIIGRR